MHAHQGSGRSEESIAAPTAAGLSRLSGRHTRQAMRHRSIRSFCPGRSFALTAPTPLSGRRAAQENPRCPRSCGGNRLSSADSNAINALETENPSLSLCRHARRTRRLRRFALPAALPASFSLDISQSNKYGAGCQSHFRHVCEKGRGSWQSLPVHARRDC